MKHTVPDFKELFKQASEIAAQVPEAMQAAAFNRAIDLLTGNTPTVLATRESSRSQNSPTKASPTTQGATAAIDVDVLLMELDSTLHPGVGATSKILDRALMILQIAHTEHGVDGLTPPQIARILTDKFRINTKNSAVSMALGGATKLVNRVPQGNGFLYRIMAAGVDYVAHLAGETTPGRPAAAIRAKKRRATGQSNKDSSPTNPSASDGTGVTVHTETREGRRSKIAGEKPGPKSAIRTLLSEGYFAKPRTGQEVQDFLNRKRGMDIGTAQLRLAMLRLVRDKELDRDENAQGQYEYKHSGS
ncbi:MAG: hypothetical protein QOE70_760 [Chthoniobacter sp.]|jgi:hypothetical protein|nr:hypothetical protein [Chthoniobacter sp.]